jgi:hypothetical protein
VEFLARAELQLFDLFLERAFGHRMVFLRELFPP